MRRRKLSDRGLLVVDFLQHVFQKLVAASLSGTAPGLPIVSFTSDDFSYYDHFDWPDEIDWSSRTERWLGHLRTRQGSAPRSQTPYATG